MATIKNVLLKGCRGRLGEYVIYQCRGKTCIRSRGNYENMAFTPEQKAQQERFASSAMLYRAAKAVGLEKYWRSAAENTTLSGYNLFMRYNLPAFTGEGLICDFEKLRLNTGVLKLPNNMKVYEGDVGEWIVEWKNNAPYPGTAGNDHLVVALMKREDVFTIIIPDIPDYRRQDECAVIRFPPEFKDYVHLYCYFCSDTGEKSSESRYFLLTP